MEQKLSHSQTILVLLAVLLVHIGILISIVITRFDTLPPEATILFAEEQATIDHPQEPTNDWVMMSQAVATPPAPQAMQPIDQQPDQSKPQDDPPQETTPITQEQSVDHAVAIAQKLLEQMSKEKPSPTAPAHHIQQAQTPPLTNPPLTLAQLTQGFMQQLQESPMTVRSNQQGNASMEQLQQMHYLQKIIGCLVNTYRIHTNSTLISLPMEQARIKLTIKRDGSIHTLHLVQSSGNVTVDQFLINLFQDASSSFPPMPTSIKQDIFDVPLFTVERLESFHSTNGWYIDNTIP